MHSKGKNNISFCLPGEVVASSSANVLIFLKALAETIV